MPDLVTHSAVAWILGRKGNFEYRIIFYLGAILPDVLARPIYILFPKYYLYSIAVHTPVFMIIFSLLFAEFFDRNIKRKIFGYLLLGVLLHFLLDALQKHLVTGYFWLFPFSWYSTSFGLFWSESFINIIPYWFLLIAIVELFLFFQKKMKKSSL